MPRELHSTLSRRERQIIHIQYRLGRATANEVMADLPGEPNYSTVWAQPRVLESKGHVRHEAEGLRYIYMPTVPRHQVRQFALLHQVEPVFDGSHVKTLPILVGS